MTSTRESRSASLDAFLEDRQAHGYSIETRTELQAIVVRRRRLLFRQAWFQRGSERRLVVSVDEHGNVTAIAAEPRRW